MFKGLCVTKIVVVSSPGDCPLRNTGHCLVEGTDDKTLDFVLLKGIMTKHWTLSC